MGCTGTNRPHTVIRMLWPISGGVGVRKERLLGGDKGMVVTRKGGRGLIGVGAAAEVVFRNRFKDRLSSLQKLPFPPYSPVRQPSIVELSF
jgi:hypothetical protein